MKESSDYKINLCLTKRDFLKLKSLVNINHNVTRKIMKISRRLSQCYTCGDEMEIFF